MANLDNRSEAFKAGIDQWASMRRIAFGLCRSTWEALNKNLKAIELAALSFLRDGLSWKLDGN